MQLHISIIPDEIIAQYQLLDIVTADGWVYIEMGKGIYGLKQAGSLTNKQLTKQLEPAGYIPTPHTPGLWTHQTRNIKFSLVVNNFCIKYTDKLDAEHLLSTLRTMYTAATDWTGSLYCGLTIKWKYEKKHVNISMPGYVAAALHKFKHPAPNADDTTDKLAPSAVTIIQQIIGTLLYYSLAVDPTMLVALGTIAATQANANKATAEAVVHLLNYAATHPDAVIRYHASGMVLYIHSDGSYLSAPNSRSQASGHHFLSDAPINPHQAPLQRLTLKGPIHLNCHILRNVMASAA